MDDRQAFRDRMLPPRAQRAQDGIDHRAFQAAQAGERAAELVLSQCKRPGAWGDRAVKSPTLPARRRKGIREVAPSRRAQGATTCQMLLRLSPSTSPAFLSSFQ